MTKRSTSTSSLCSCLGCDVTLCGQKPHLKLRQAQYTLAIISEHISILVANLPWLTTRKDGLGGESDDRAGGGAGGRGADEHDGGSFDTAFDATIAVTTSNTIVTSLIAAKDQMVAARGHGFSCGY
eukprot:6182456-Pleurochrysis_carterae.AAC.2